MDTKKSIKDYNISYANHYVFASIPLYYFSSQPLIKMLKTGGYWEHEGSMVVNLGLEVDFNKKKVEYSGDLRKAMTAVMMAYLEATYPE